MQISILSVLWIKRGDLVKFFFAQQLGFSPISGGGHVQSLQRINLINTMITQQSFQ